jgi:hypothetical protein
VTASAPNRAPSAIDALGEAISHTRHKLFPFNFAGWITLGFVSLLESCGSGSGTGSLQNRIDAPGSLKGPAQALETIFAWIAAHMVIFVSGLMVVMLLSLLFMWLRSRTIFVYIDDVASGRFDLVRPWNEHGARADSYFVLSLVVQGASFILLVLIMGLGGFFVLWADANDWRSVAIALGLFPLVFVFFLAVLVAGVLNAVLRDFVAPLQVCRDTGSREAWNGFWSLFRARPGLFIGYGLLKIVAGIAIGIVVIICACLTCCIGILPLVHQTLFQPIYYAERAWSLRLLAQMGENVFTRLAPPSGPPPSSTTSAEEAPTEPIDLSQLPQGPPPVQAS